MDQSVKENLISSQFANNYRNTARIQTKNLDMKKLCFGSRFVPASKAIKLQQNDIIVFMRWDCDSNIDSQTCIHTLFMNPQYPQILYPLQKFNGYGLIPYLIPIFSSTMLANLPFYIRCQTETVKVSLVIVNIQLDFVQLLLFLLIQIIISILRYFSYNKILSINLVHITCKYI